MDQTLKYLEMCSKLPSEIKNLVPRDHYGCMVGDKSFFGYHERLNGLVWLPRQDQLQDMILSNGKYKLHNLINKFHEFIHQLSMEPDSMEQLWLTFVMHEKYNKRWNDKEWI